MEYEDIMYAELLFLLSFISEEYKGSMLRSTLKSFLSSVLKFLVFSSSVIATTILFPLSLSMFITTGTTKKAAKIKRKKNAFAFNAIVFLKNYKTKKN